MVDVRFSQISKLASATADTNGRVSQLAKLVSYKKLPPNVPMSQLVKLVSVEVFEPPVTHLISQLVKLVSWRVPPIGTACEVEPIQAETSVFGLIDADWIEQIEMDTSWITDVAASKEDLAEDRTIAARRPTREIKVTLSGASQRNAARLSKYLARLAKNRNSVPLWQDRRTLSTTATSGATDELILTGGTAYRRFYPGQHVGIARPDGLQIDYLGGLEVVLLTIDQVLSDRLVLTANVPVTLLAGWDVYPMIDCELLPQSSMGLPSDYYGRATIGLLEIAGCSTLPASSGEDVSALFDYIDGYPVLDLAENWKDGIEAGHERVMDTYQSGRSSGNDPSGERGVFVGEFDFGPCDRETFWEALQFHDSRRGRGRAFWVLHPETQWTFVASGLDYIDVRPFGAWADIPEFFSHVAYIEPDGTLGIREIVAATLETGPVHRIHLDAISVSPPAIISRVTAAMLCREGSDSMKEVWANEELCSSLTIKVRELLREESVSIG